MGSGDGSRACSAGTSIGEVSTWGVAMALVRVVLRLPSVKSLACVFSFIVGTNCKR